MYNLIQIALLGETSIVVEEGLKKSLPDKLYIIHTKNEENYSFELEAHKLKTKIETQYKIPTKLLRVDAFDIDQNIRIILTTITNEKKANPSLVKRDFAINITGGTKPMVAAASTAAFLAGSRIYYVREASKQRGDDLVKELPMPAIPEDDSRGNTSRTTAIVLQKIKKLEKCTNQMLLDEVRKDRRLGINQRIEYHLKKLEQKGLITISLGWQTKKINSRTGKPYIDRKRRTIMLTSSGEYFAEFPGLMATII